MRNIPFFVGFAWLLCGFPSHGQKASTLQGYEVAIVETSEKMFSASSENERFHANEELLQLFNEMLSLPKSFSIPFKNLKRISLLTAPDNKFRIFTWSVIEEDGSFSPFGYIQVKNEKENTYDFYPLINKADEIDLPENALLNDSCWFGSIYYDLIEHAYKDKKYYTLLGWDGHNIYSQRKVIETLTFTLHSTRPKFGIPLFYREKTIRRRIFEYSKDIAMVLSYEKQLFEEKKPSQKKKKKTKKSSIQIAHKQDYMLVYEELTPNYNEMTPIYKGMKGLYQYYTPSGEMLALRFINGKWRPVEKPLPRNNEKTKDPYVPSGESQHPQKKVKSPKPLYNP